MNDELIFSNCDTNEVGSFGIQLPITIRPPGFVTQTISLATSKGLGANMAPNTVRVRSIEWSLRNQGIYESVYAHRRNLVADRDEDGREHKGLHVDLRKSGRSEGGTRIAAQIAALEYPFPWSLNHPLQSVVRRTDGCCDMFDTGKASARPQHAAHLGQDLRRTIDRAQNQRTEHEIHRCGRKIEILAGKTPKIQIDPVLVSSAAQHVVHLPVGFDGDEPRAGRQVAKIGAGTGSELDDDRWSACQQTNLDARVFCMHVAIERRE